MFLAQGEYIDTYVLFETSLSQEYVFILIGFLLLPIIVWIYILKC